MAGFPNSPSIGETYTLGTKVWEWDGTIWKIKTTGAVGPQGVQGAQGNQGTAGAAGVQGNQGWQGSVGPQGNQGRQGISGPQGNQGNQGLKGDQGNQGNQGNQGIAGLSATGVQGPQGNQGRQGVSGPQGNQGNQGRQGNQGNQGNQGRQGPTGSFGLTSVDLLTAAKFRVSPIFAKVNNDQTFDTDYFGAFEDIFTYQQIEYDQTAQSTIFTDYGERSNSFGDIAATESADLRLGTIVYTTFGGFTGTSTIDITGYNISNDSAMVKNVMFVFNNPSGNTPPTITFTAKGSTTAVLFSDETGAPVFAATSQAVMIPFAYLETTNKWYAGSQLTFNL